MTDPTPSRTEGPEERMPDHVSEAIETLRGLLKSQEHGVRLEAARLLLEALR